MDCPICHNKKFDYESSAECYGTVEQHGYCSKCGYIIEQAYSPVCEGFRDTVKGFKDAYGRYHEKDIKKHRRNRRKAGVKNEGPMDEIYIGG